MAFGGSLLKKRKQVTTTIKVKREHLLDSLIPTLSALGYVKRDDDVIELTANLPDFIKIVLTKEYISASTQAG